MKLLASDYDGTLRRPYVKQSDIKAIKRFRAAGNVFGIITGRTLEMILPEIKLYRIPVDFVIGINGGIMVNQEEDLLYKHEIDPVIAEQVSAQIQKENVQFAVIGDGFHSVMIKGERTNSIKKFLTRTVYKLFGKNKKIGTPANFVIEGKNEEETIAICNRFDKLFGKYITCHRNGKTIIDITASGVSKYTGVEEARKRFSVDQVYVIGDSFNDLPMIEAYDGFTVDTAIPEIQEKASKVFSNYTDLVDYLLMVEND